LRTRKKIKRAGEVVLVDSILWFARILPRDVGLRVFGALGGLAGMVLRKDRRRAVANLEIAFPEMPRKIRDAMVGAMFKALGRNAYEFLTLEGSSGERISGLVEKVEGAEHLDAARRSGRGLIAITGHIGCWELLAAYFANNGYDVNVIGRELWDRRINERVVRIRRSVGYRTIDRDSGGKEMMRILRNGGIVAVLIDQHTRVAGVYVPFFERPAHTPVGVAKLALATGAVILPMAIHMTRKGRHVIRIMPAVEVEDGGGDRETLAEEITARCSLAIEDLIRHDPKQWVWFHRRWRGSGKGEGDYAAIN